MTHEVVTTLAPEEIVIAAVPAAGGSAVRGSTLLFDQQVKRFFTTLPASGVGAA